MKTLDQAIGSYEAACLMGVHFTQPKRMAERGLLTTRTFAQNDAAVDIRSVAIFSRDECEKDFQEYEEMFKASGGKTSRRPRSCIPLRAGALRALAKMKCQIAFGDAIGTFDAAKILGVHFTLVSRLVTQGKIVGRVLYSKRSGAQRSWIFSRASCEKEKAENRMAVGMPGRKRNPS